MNGKWTNLFQSSPATTLFHDQPKGIWIRNATKSTAMYTALIHVRVDKVNHINGISF